jgi:hypothetical protein
MEEEGKGGQGELVFDASACIRKVTGFLLLILFAPVVFYACIGQIFHAIVE